MPDSLIGLWISPAPFVRFSSPRLNEFATRAGPVEPAGLTGNWALPFCRFREGGRPQWVDATPARRLPAGVSKPKAFSFGKERQESNIDYNLQSMDDALPNNISTTVLVS